MKHTEIFNSIKVLKNVPIDFRYGPWNNNQEALTQVPLGIRVQGLIIGILQPDKSIKLYWFRNGVEDANLVVLNPSLYDLWIDNGNTGSLQDFLDDMGGAQGNDAYQVWLAQGNSGSVTDFFNSLVGPEGKTAFESWLEYNTGTEQDFVESLKGKNAYQIWLELGNTGSVQDFLDSLRGTAGPSAFEEWKVYTGNADATFLDFLDSLKGGKGDEGKDAYQVWISKGNAGTEQEFFDSLKGNDGKSLYDIWTDLGNLGSEEDMVNSFKGKSFYQIWLDEGNTGTIAEMIESFKGAKGDGGESAYKVWLDQGNSGTEDDFFRSLRALIELTIENEDIYVMEWTPQLKSKFGNVPIFSIRTYISATEYIVDNVPININIDETDNILNVSFQLSNLKTKIIIH